MPGSGTTSATMTETQLEGLREVIQLSFEPKMQPQFAKIEDVFNVMDSKKAQEFDLEMKGVGEFEERGQLEDISPDYLAEKYKTSYTHVNFDKSIPIPIEYIEDELYNIIKKGVAGLGYAARHTQYKTAFNVLNRGFNASYPGADGVSLFSNEHPRDYSPSAYLDNKLTSKLSSDSLDLAMTMLIEQKSHSNISVPGMPKLLLVPTKRFGLATELTESELVPDSNNNAVNFISKKYGIMVKQSQYIGSAFGGSDDAWFLLSDIHFLNKFIRKAFNQWLIPWDISDNKEAKYCAGYRESVGWSSGLGVIGSTGEDGTY